MTAIATYLRRAVLPLVSVDTFAWLLHRLTGVALAVYLVPHLISINAARGGAALLDAELATFKTPFFAVAEWVLIGAVAYHAFNGLRLIALDVFDLSSRQRGMFLLVLLATVIVLGATTWLFVPRILAPLG